MKGVCEMDPGHVVLNGKDVTPHQIVEIAQGRAKVGVDDRRLDHVRTVRHWVTETGKHEDVYGYTRGCGDKQDQVIKEETMAEYQRRYLNVHCVGVGEPFVAEVVRAAMAIRLNSFLLGHSAVSPELIMILQDMLNADVVPIVPMEGSVGASGDLCQLAYVGAVINGFPEVQARVKGDGPFSAPEALAKAGLKPYVFGGKEAMAMTNGANFMLAQLILSLPRLDNFFKLACAATAMTVEAIRGLPAAFDPRVHEVRPLPGQVESARLVWKLLEGSQRATPQARQVALPWSPRKTKEPFEVATDKRMQDFYSVRCFPQIIHPFYAALVDAKNVVAIELNSATDNPLYFPRADGNGWEAISCGNFHGQPLADVCDRLIAVIAKVGVTSNYHTMQLLLPWHTTHLPVELDFTCDSNNTGFMIAQYTAARLVAHLQKLSFPAGVLTHPTSGMQEDVVSMGSISAQDLYQEVLWRAETVLAIEILAAIQAISGITKHFLGAYPLAPATQRIWELVMDNVPRNAKAKELGLVMADDHFLQAKMDAVVELLPQIAGIISEVCATRA